MRSKIKIAYLGKIQLSDTDFSYLHEAQKLADITYYMEVSPRFMNGPAISFQKLYPHNGIYKAVDIYPEFEKYAQFIDLEKCYVVNTIGRLWFVKSVWLNILLLITLWKQRFQVVHIVWPLNLYELFLYFLHNRMILTVHDPFPHTGANSRIVNIRRKIAFHLIHNLILLNQNQKKDFIKYYKLHSKNIINSRLSIYQSLHVLDCSKSVNSDKYILAFGRISPYKGFDYLLPAMEKVHELHPDVKLIIAGNGFFHFDVSRYKDLEYIDIRNRYIPDDEMVTLIKNAMFMVCVYTDATQSGVIMSSYAFNRPVIVTNVGGLPEMVINNRHGLVIKEKDVDAISTSIIKLLDSPETLELFSKNIKYDYSSGHLSWHSIAVELVNEYLHISKTARLL